ncbi:DNA-binding protein WhiA [Acetobacterium sp.]|uniref:DNA-binding protein WhiA n=1 Tax=Acetobacterium sp. TaxID=1872094 RepID=UPI002718BE2B|nr:DNA-binding protein WhiA [Acetobacterium sp.]MDO9493448.1 DNA-binding protein WhiA [Acetobacterium sp.]
MTFSAILKKDLSKLPFGSKACQRAELSGMIGSVATISVDEKGAMAISIKTENPAVAARCYQLLKTLYNIKPKIKIEKTRKFKEHRAYRVVVEEPWTAKIILEDCQILTYNTNGQAFFANQVPDQFIKQANQTKAYIRGAFLGCGSVSNPEKTYHLELVGKKTPLANKKIEKKIERSPATGSEQCAYLQSIKTILDDFDIKSNLIHRKAHWVLYLKEGSSVADFLSVIGAHRGLLEMENIRIVKEMRNDVNRQVNCETANLNKTIVASYDQVADIMLIKEQLGLKNLPRNLYDIAELRLNYPDASIKELGERLDPPVGKSGVYHRLKKLNQIAADLKQR